jgi:Tfp pilus assembly protein PilN
MIKVNLLRNLGLAQSGGAAPGIQVIAVDQQKQGALKAGGLLLVPLLLYGYQLMNMSSLTEQRDSLNRQVSDVEQKRAAFGDTGPKVEKFTQEKAKIDQQIEVIRGIARNRLREVKAFDSLQTLTPSQVWFDKIEIDDHNLVKATGFSNTPDGVETLYVSLDHSPQFSKFEPKGQTQETVAGNQVIKFNIEFRIGRE